MRNFRGLIKKILSDTRGLLVQIRATKKVIDSIADIDACAEATYEFNSLFKDDRMLSDSITAFADAPNRSDGFCDVTACACGILLDFADLSFALNINGVKHGHFTFEDLLTRMDSEDFDLNQNLILPESLIYRCIKALFAELQRITEPISRPDRLLIRRRRVTFRATVTITTEQTVEYVYDENGEGLAEAKDDFESCTLRNAIDFGLDGNHRYGGNVVDYAVDVTLQNRKR